jgi:steroid 5-alpha reductase family enzyme
MGLLWAYQLKSKDAGIVDVGWTFSIGILATWYIVTGQGNHTRTLILNGLIILWSLRLGLYLLFNRIIGKEEDGRYKALRAHWGENAHFNFFFFFQAQAFLAVLLSLPVILISNDSKTFGGEGDIIAVTLIVISIVGESIADKQLANWRKNPVNKGRTCRAGLWHYSRHPNYFFEWLHWWFYVAATIHLSYGWLSLSLPALMLFFLLRVTGIPYTELQAVKSRGDDYREYQRTTSAFIPWLPKK